jgi:hypothetical protein
MILFTSWYHSDNEQRNEENRICLQKNFENPLISKIILLCDNNSEESVCVNSKIGIVIVGDRPTYADFFKVMQGFPDDIKILANSDIYFDDTLSYIRDMPEGNCYALTRWDDKEHGKFLNPNPGSQDVWIFKGKLKDIYGDFQLGFWACDCRLIYELRKAGYVVQNPCITIKTYHLHRELRNLAVNPYPDKTIPGPHESAFICSLNEVNDLHLAIGVPHSHPMVSMAFFDSFVGMEKPPYTYLRCSTGHIEDMRNELVKKALHSDCTHLIMMDTDQIYHEKTISRLLSHKLPIVGCLVYRRYPPFDPLMFRGSQGKYLGITEWEEDGLIDVDATGTGCLMFDMDIFKKLPEPWFKEVKSEDGKVTGEDFYFCEKAREAGYEIFVDTSIPAGHLSQMIINEGTWKLYNHVKEAELKQNHAIKHGVIVNQGGMQNGI